MKRLKIKISVFNKKLWGNFLKWASGVATVYTTVLAFVDICAKIKWIIFGCFIGTLCEIDLERKAGQYFAWTFYKR